MAKETGTTTRRPDSRHNFARLEGGFDFDKVFRRETLSGLKLATIGRLVSLSVVAILLCFLMPIQFVYYYHILLVIFVLFGITQYVLMLKGLGSWVVDVFIALDFALLTFTLFSPNPLDTSSIPLQFRLRHDPIVYYFLLLSSVAFSFSPRRMLWAGISAGLGWTAGVFWLMTLPGTVMPWNQTQHMTAEKFYLMHLDPLFVDTDMWLQDLILLLLVSGILAMVVRRSRQLVIRQAEAMRHRASLARYFSPNVLDEVMDSVGPLDTVRKYDVAILFADIVGFTQLCETMPPEHVIWRCCGLTTPVSKRRCFALAAPSTSTLATPSWRPLAPPDPALRTPPTACFAPGQCSTP